MLNLNIQFLFWHKIDIFKEEFKIMPGSTSFIFHQSRNSQERLLEFEMKCSVAK